MKYGEAILKELKELRAEVFKLGSEVHLLKQKLDDPFESEMQQPVREPVQERKSIESVAVSSSPNRFKDNITDETRRSYENILHLVERNPDLLKRIVRMRNMGTTYSGILEAVKTYHKNISISKSRLTTILPVACRYGLVTKSKGKYTYVSHTLPEGL